MPECNDAMSDSKIDRIVNRSISTRSISRINMRVDLEPGACVEIVVTELTDKQTPRILYSEKHQRAVQPVEYSGEEEEVVVSTSGKLVDMTSIPADFQEIEKKAIIGESHSVWQIMHSFWRILSVNIDLQSALFLLALAIYLSTRLVGLSDFPIYFFTDEAVQTVLASDFIRDGFQNYDKEIFPTFFENNTLYCLSISVYIQIIPYLLFGKSVFVTRVTAMLITLLAAIWMGLILRDGFKIKQWWLGPLLLSITPAWFIHSRTAFEYCLLGTFFTGFIYYYLLYRIRNPRYLFIALVMGALAFYSYMPGQIIMVSTGLLLLLLDCRYHWEKRKTGLLGLGLLILLVLPLVRFIVAHPTEFSDRLIRYRSYWITNLSIIEKILRFINEYLSGLNPGYWFFTNDYDLMRHVMKGYGHVLWITLPFIVLGLFLVLKNFWKSGQARTLVAAVLAAPTAAATIAMGLSRALVMVIPLNILAGIGIAWLIEWWLKKKHIVGYLKIITPFFLLAALNYYMLWDVLINGPTWFHDYNLGGMQYGARQVFTEVNMYLKENPSTKVDVSPNWTNGADVIARFFLYDPLPIQMRSIDGYLTQKQPMDSNNLFVMTDGEYQKALSSHKFSDIVIEKTIIYPDGSPGFHFIRLRYVDQIDTIFADEAESRRALREKTLQISGSRASVKYSFLDMGIIDHLFDGDLGTLVRTMEANPMVVQIMFDDQHPAEGLVIKVGGGPTEIQVEVESDISPNQTFRSTLMSIPNPREISFDFKQTLLISAVLIKVRNTDIGEPSHVHVWEVKFK